VRLSGCRGETRPLRTGQRPPWSTTRRRTRRRHGFGRSHYSPERREKPEKIQSIREESAARQAVARRALQGFEFQAHPEEHHLWLTLPERWRRANLNLSARQSALALVPSGDFTVGLATDSIRVSIGAAQNQAVLERGLGLLATVVSHGPSALL
jgi:DNA-binding transcriptional MocR family regulator